MTIIIIIIKRKIRNRKVCSIKSNDRKGERHQVENLLVVIRVKKYQIKEENSNSSTRVLLLFQVNLRNGVDIV